MIVPDASVVVKLFAEEPGSDAAMRLLATGDEFAAPDLLMIEVGNALWHKVRKSLLLEIHAKRSLDEIPSFFAFLYPTVDLLDDAWRLAYQLRHPLSDCAYLALALRLGVRLVTADEKFMAKASLAYGGTIEALA